MARKSSNSGTKKKLTDAERHKRFKDMGEEVGASKDPKDFEKAFRKITSSAPKKIV